MKRLFIGCPVRITYVMHAENAHLVGKAFRIVSCDIRTWILDFEREGDPYRGFFADQLEPIQPSGHRAGDYSLSDLLDRCRAGEGVPA